MSDGAILAIDTAFGPIGVALCSASGDPIAGEALSNTLGAQAEKLPPLVEQLFAKARLSPRALGRIAVTVGPGAFTGVRVGLAFAKGMASALKLPVLGFTTLACLGTQARTARQDATNYVSVIDARRSEFYVQGFDRELNSLFGPGVMSADQIVSAIAGMAGACALAGSGARAIADQLRGRRPGVEALEIETIDARLLAVAASAAEPGAHPPVPCYLRDADARLPS